MSHPLPGKLSRSPRVFSMIRGADESGVSGTGKVLEGALFSDGTVVVRWLTPHVASTTGVYDSFEDFENIHINSHPGNQTRIIWHSGPIQYEVG